MRLRSIGLVAVLTLASCGSSGASDDELSAMRKRAEGFRAEVSSLRSEFRAQASRHRAFSVCKSQTNKLRNTLSDLDSRLDVGVFYQEYVRRVGTISVAYDRVRWGRISDECKREVTEATRKAFNQYWRAERVWDECIDNLFSCSMDGITPDLRAHWRRASDLIGQGRKGLRQISEPKPDSSLEAQATDLEKKAAEIEDRITSEEA